MSISEAAFCSQHENFNETPTVIVDEAHWGLIVRGADKAASKDAVLESILKLLSIAVLFAAIAPWVYTDPALGLATGMTQMSLSAAFFVAGFGVYSHAGRGFRQEVHLDAIDAEIRFATRNSRNISTTRERIPMMHVQGCFLKPNATKSGDAQILLRLKSTNRILTLATGPEYRLLAVLDQMARIVNVSETRGRF